MINTSPECCLPSSLLLRHSPRSSETNQSINPVGRKDADDERLAEAREQGPTTKPNVFFFFIDDMGWNDIGYQSTDLSELTPNLDKLAAGGIKVRDELVLSCRFLPEPKATQGQDFGEKQHAVADLPRIEIMWLLLHSSLFARVKPPWHHQTRFSRHTFFLWLHRPRIVGKIKRAGTPHVMLVK